MPRWSGIVWASATVVVYVLGYVLGFALGVATTGASLPTQPVGAALLAVSGTAMVWAAAYHARTRFAGQQSQTATTVSSGR